MNQPVVWVKKTWGDEEVIVNNELYCGKILHLDGGFRSSLHRHRSKAETFYVLYGTPDIEISGVVFHPVPGTAYTIPPGVWHRFWSDGPAKIIEFSTHHEDEDVERRELSGRLKEGDSGD